jgi:hypothetical protein
MRREQKFTYTKTHTKKYLFCKCLDIYVFSDEKGSIRCHVVLLKAFLLGPLPLTHAKFAGLVTHLTGPFISIPYSLATTPGKKNLAVTNTIHKSRSTRVRHS